MNLAFFELRNKTTLDISSGSPNRFIGTVLSRYSFTSFSFDKIFLCQVPHLKYIFPGATTFTRTVSDNFLEIFFDKARIADLATE